MTTPLRSRSDDARTMSVTGTSLSGRRPPVAGAGGAAPVSAGRSGNRSRGRPRTTTPTSGLRPSGGRIDSRPEPPSVAHDDGDGRQGPGRRAVDDGAGRRIEPAAVTRAGDSCVGHAHGA